jgi:hypothetical protein
MKAYCKICALIQPSSFRPSNDATTGASYEDLCCDTCHFIVATVEEREALAQPAQRPWVGLTDEDRREIFDATERDDRGYVAALVEAKLMEKNNAT